jgi:hypothetical protein
MHSSPPPFDVTLTDVEGSFLFNETLQVPSVSFIGRGLDDIQGQLNDLYTLPVALQQLLSTSESPSVIVYKLNSVKGRMYAVCAKHHVNPPRSLHEWTLLMHQAVDALDEHLSQHSLPEHVWAPLYTMAQVTSTLIRLFTWQ